jgi:hypothetical protein
MADTRRKITSGFCSIGHCEGTKPTGSISGTPMKTCEWTSAACSCKCHADLDEMFRMMDMERVSQLNPDYREPEELEKLRATLAAIRDQRATFTRPDAPPPVIIESPAPDVVPATVQRSFAATATGRAARGQLESQVKEACDLWAITGSTKPCTPGWISEYIQTRWELAKPPSQGAINSVLERWTAIDFAVTAKKPTRFVSYTENGLKYGLETQKVRAKTAQRMGTAAMMREGRR